MHAPTPPRYPPMGGDTYWRLISHLSLNFLSLSDGGPKALAALREILKLYSFNETSAVHQQINGIREMTCRKVVRRTGEDAWRGFARGTAIELLFDESNFVGSSAFLLASVLNRFFGMYAACNSFTELTIRSRDRDGIWKQWQPVAGTESLL
jgi:type VI secretion system protein ImpG